MRNLSFFILVGEFEVIFLFNKPKTIQCSIQRISYSLERILTEDSLESILTAVGNLSYSIESILTNEALGEHSCQRDKFQNITGTIHCAQPFFPYLCIVIQRGGLKMFSDVLTLNWKTPSATGREQRRSCLGL